MSNKPEVNPRSRRAKVTADVFTGFQAKEDVADGYVLRYPNTESWNETLTAFVEMWTPSCPFFVFDLATDADGSSLLLEIHGPEGTKNWIDSAHRMLTTNLNPVATWQNRGRWKLAGLTRTLRILPDFLIIGAMKCGTTSLYAHLCEHPRAMPALRKEINFFNSPQREPISSYRRYFPTVFRKRRVERRHGRPAVTGEATPTYLFSSLARDRIAAELPGVKLIAILRNPTDRAYSAYQHRLRQGVEPRSFEDSAAAEIEGRDDQEGSYLAWGLYAAELEKWLEKFASEQLLVVSTEDLDRAPATTLGRVYEHLSLPAIEAARVHKLNAVPYPAMAPATRRRLLEFFAPHNQRLYEMLGRDLGWEQ